MHSRPGHHERPDRDGRTDARRPPRSLLFTVIGCLLVAIGAVGVVLPVLPTTPFMLLAAACFARSSDRLHAWLLDTRLFGPTLRAWYETGSIPLCAKIAAIALIILMLGLAITIVVTHPAARFVLAVTGVSVIAYLVCIPTRVGADGPTERASTETADADL